jgi:MFS family permease
MSLSPRATITLTFFAFGAIAGANIGALPMLVKQANMSSLQFGAMAGIGALVNMSIMAMGGFINRHFDHRSILLLAFPVAFIFMAYGMIATSFLGYAIAIIGLSVGLGAIDLMMNAEAAEIEQHAGVPMFNSFHASVLYGLGGFAIISSAISIWLAPWFVCLAVIIPVIPAFAAIYKVLEKRAVKTKAESKAYGPLPLRLLTFVGLAIGFEVAAEITAIQWAGQLLAQNIPQLAAYSGLGAAFYGLCSGTVRFFSDALRARFGEFVVIVTGLVIAMLCLLVLSFSPSFAVSVLAFAGVGAGFAPLFPCLFSLAARLAPEAKAAALGHAVLVGAAPRAILPWVLGWLAQQYNLGAVFAATTVVAAMALTIILTTFRQANAAAKA